MTYWRMQLHPNKAAKSMQYAAESLAAGFIGLDFAKDPGDLTLCEPSKLSVGERKYLDLWRRMKVGDKVLVISHHFPLALATVDGEYNYMRTIQPELKVWFRHFRRVTDV